MQNTKLIKFIGASLWGSPMRSFGLDLPRPILARKDCVGSDPPLGDLGPRKVPIPKDQEKWNDVRKGDKVEVAGRSVEDFGPVVKDRKNKVK